MPGHEASSAKGDARKAPVTSDRSWPYRSRFQVGDEARKLCDAQFFAEDEEFLELVKD
jgi:hypothetical protein